MISVREINVILFRYWDPISVNQNNHLKDEYSDVAEEIWRLTKDPSLSIHAIVEALHEMERQWGLEATEECRLDTASRILEAVSKQSS